MAKTPPALTAARKRGLSVLLDAALHDRGALRISNQTTDVSVYWQVATWLIRNGLADTVGGDYVALTPAGRDIAKAVAS